LSGTSRNGGASNQNWKADGIREGRGFVPSALERQSRKVVRQLLILSERNMLQIGIDICSRHFGCCAN